MSLDRRFLSTPLAHRGLHDQSAGRIENSLGAIDAAIEHGYGIEIDVQRSSDGVPMVFHDDVLGRLTDQTGLIADAAASDLTEIALSGSTDRIPTLDAVLERVASRVPLLIEIKDQDGAMGPETHGLADAVAASLDGYLGPVALMSFNPHLITRIAEIAPERSRGLVTDAFAAEDWPGIPETRLADLATLPDARQHHFISHNRKDLTNPRVLALRDRGMPILTWTIRSPEEATQAREVADTITFEGYLP